MKLDKRFEIRLSDIEFKQLKENAKRSNLKVSEYIRKRAVYNRDFMIDKKEVIELNYQLSKIGNNINQISKIANYTRSIHKEEIDRMKKEFLILQSDVYKITSILLNISKAGI